MFSAPMSKQTPLKKQQAVVLQAFLLLQMPQFLNGKKF